MKAWRKVNVSFGLINIQMSLTPMFGQSGVRGKTVCAHHHVPVNNKQYCPTCKGTPKDTRKAYDNNGKMVFIGLEDMPVAEMPSKTVKLESFVPFNVIDPAYFNNTYLLFPSDSPNAQGYVLLREALRDLEVFAAGETILDKSPEAVLIRYSPPANGLVLHTLHYHDTLRSESMVEIDRIVGNASVTDQEVQLAKQLVSGSVTPSFDVTKYHDTYYDALRKVISSPPKKRRKKAEPTVTPISQADNLAGLLTEMMKGAKNG